MAESAELLTMQFLSWVADRPRSYDDAMEAWQSHCPRQTIWEDAIIDGLIEIKRTALSHEVVLTPRGKALVNARARDHKNRPAMLHPTS